MLNSKSQILNPKQIQNSKFKKSKRFRFGHSNIGILIFFGIWCLGFRISAVYAFDLTPAKTAYLRGDYKGAIDEGERLMATVGMHTPGLDELYYLMGLSYMKSGNCLRASDIFEIILKEFPDSSRKEEALLGIADSYFLRDQYEQAERAYKMFIDQYPHSRLLPVFCSRLNLVALKRGDGGLARSYLSRLKAFPGATDLLSSRQECALVSANTGSLSTMYSVQVGAFSKSENAGILKKKLARQGYDAYVEQTIFQGKTTYRVKVGKFAQTQEAQALERKLSHDGFPTKLCP